MWNLVRAQAQANRAATRWFVGLLTVLLTITTYLLVEAGTQGELNRRQEAITGGVGDWIAWVEVLDGSPLGDDVNPDRYLTLDQLIEVVDRANAEGNPARIQAWGIGDFRGAPNYELYSPPTISLVYGDIDWGAALVEGRAPTAAGEIAINADVARDQGVGVGDQLVILRVQNIRTPESMDVEYVPAARTVVGITGNLDLPGYDNTDTAVLTPLADLTLGSESLASGFSDNGLLGVTVAWTGNSGELQSLTGLNSLGRGAPSGARLPQSTASLLAMAVTLIVGIIIMAFAVGRTQAQNRIRWVATTRTLGASSARVALATCFETLVNSAVAVAISLPLGYGFAAAHLAWARSVKEPTLAPTLPLVEPFVIPVVIGVALGVSVIAGAVPAFWASRVPPVAAFAPINDLTEAEVSRRVPARWLVYASALSVAALMASRTILAGNIVASVLGVLGLVVVGSAIVVEVLRRASAWAGRRMARSNNPTLISAGDTLSAHPRQATAGALLLAVAVGVGSYWLILMTQVYGPWTWSSGEAVSYQAWDAASDVLTRQGVLGALVALVTLQLVAVAISLGHSRALAPETALRSALGQRADDARCATWITHVVPQVGGAIVGALVPVGLLAAGAAWQWLTDPQPPGAYGNGTLGQVLPLALLMIGALLLAVIVIAALGGALLARSTARGTPVEGLREAALVGAS